MVVPRRSSGFTTTCSVGVDCVVRITLSQRTLTRSAACPGLSWALAVMGDRIANVQMTATQRGLIRGHLSSRASWHPVLPASTAIGERGRFRYDKRLPWEIAIRITVGECWIGRGSSSQAKALACPARLKCVAHCRTVGAQARCACPGLSRPRMLHRFGW